MNHIQDIAQEISITAHPNELEYFRFHQNRKARLVSYLDTHYTAVYKDIKTRVLDIGSHYLHTSMILAQMGFEVDAMDVSEFWNIDFVKARADKFGLNPIVENELSKMEAFKNVENKYDLVVFTEIMEHITFNPIVFWKRIYQILKPGGRIYISTPNAFALPNYIRNLKNTLFMKSIGITVPEIFSKVTYGHHWKEYSANEIKTYFRTLSPDFEIEINPYHYQNFELSPPYFVYKLLSRIGNKTKTFAADLEVIVHLKKKSYWSIEEPTY
jgi:2-polyprenyl-3-methyl-5-hydroxy-6-metoxy-1,4-benzoquinol methylase